MKEIVIPGMGYLLRNAEGNLIIALVGYVLSHFLTITLNELL